MNIGSRLGAAVKSGPLANGNFRLLIAGRFTSSIGDMCYAVALPWLALSGHGGPLLLGTLLAVYGVARAVAIPFGGILTDRFSPRPLMLAADTVRLACVAVIGVLSLSGLPPNAALIPLSLLLGACSGMFTPASFVIIPRLLPEGDLTAGNALGATTSQLGSLVGPAVGGILVVAAGPGPAFLIDAATFAVSAATLLAIRLRPEADTGAAPAGTEATPEQGAVRKARFSDIVRRGRLLHIIMGTALVGNLVTAGATEVALPDLAHRHFGAGGYSALLFGFSAGLIGGALIAQRRWEGNRPIVPLAGLGLVMAATIAAVPYAGGLPGAVACVTIFSVADAWSGVVVITMLQVWTPRDLLGRTMSLLTLAMTATFPIAVSLTGYLVNRIGTDVFFLVAGGAIAAAMLVALTLPTLRQYRSGDQFSVRWRPEAEVMAQSVGSEPLTGKQLLTGGLAPEGLSSSEPDSLPASVNETPRDRPHEQETAMPYDALAALRAAGHAVDLLSADQQGVLSELSQDEAEFLIGLKHRLEAAGPEVQGQELKLL